MGARAVTIHDTRKATMADLSSNFYLGEDQVGQNIADAIRPKLAELNPRVDLVVHNGDLIESIISHYTVDGFFVHPLTFLQVVVLTDAASTAEIKRIGEFCHSKNIAFVATETFGLYGYIFADFGSGFKVYDKTGEPAKNGFIELIV
jgi:ubiquitin-activating enzyme E1